MNNELYFEIDTLFLDMDHETLNLHFDQVFDNLRIQPPFQSYLWRPQFRDFRLQYPKPEAKKLLTFFKNFAKDQLHKSDKPIVG